MNLKSTMGLAILSGGLAFAGSASATDLIINGSFEEPNQGEWNGSFATYNFTAAYFAGPAIPETENPGLKYSWRHTNGNNDTPLTQRLDLSAGVAVSDIDAGTGKFAFSAWLASYTANPEVALLSVDFLDEADLPIGGRIEISGANSTYVVKNADGTGPGGWTRKNWSQYLREGSIPAGARTAIVGITHDPVAGLSGNPDTYVDLVSFDVSVSAVAIPPSVEKTIPSAGELTARPDSILDFTIRDGTTKLDTASVQLKFDGVAVIPTVTKEGDVTHVSFDPPGLLSANSSHTAQLAYSDNGTPVNSKTMDLGFTVSNYKSYTLPAPIVIESFDGVQEGQLPDGWSVYNFSDPKDANIDFGDLNSQAYADWNVINSDRFKESLLSYTAHTPTTDYQRVLTKNPTFVINGDLVDSFAQGNILFGDSGYRSGNSQVLYAVSPDYDLKGHDHLYLIFKSLWEQNQDSMGTVEYSIDEGVSWLPLLYLLDNADLIRDASGNIDAAATLSATRGDIPRFVDVDGNGHGTRYGDYIGVPEDQWATLAPYISGRADDNASASKRVEILQLPLASNESKVRFRFGHAGTDSWYYGIDDVGVYSVDAWPAPSLQLSASPSTFYVGNTERLSVTADGIGPFTYQWRKDGTPIQGATQPAFTKPFLTASDAGIYTVEVGYRGGTLISQEINISVADPGAKLLGQWDFKGNLVGECGPDIEPFSDDVAALTTFGSSADLGINGIGGQPVQAMAFSASGAFGGYRIRAGKTASTVSAAGRLNQYTLVMDLYYPASSSGWRSLFQTDPANTTDADFFINPSAGIGISGQYDGSFSLDEWHRLAIAVDLSGPGAAPSASIYIDGNKVIRRDLGEGSDGRWSFPVRSEAFPEDYALLFADENGDVAPGYVSSVQLYEGILTDTKVAALGAASVDKLPGCLRAFLSNGKVVIAWTGGAPIETATSINGPWTPLAVGTTSPLTLDLPAGGSHAFYRLAP